MKLSAKYYLEEKPGLHPYPACLAQNSDAAVSPKCRQ
jgi:hypothetical protein